MAQVTFPLGTSADEHSPVPLRAGPVTLLFGDGDLRYIRVGGREILRRVYVAVRDENWGTVPFMLEDLRIDNQGDQFRINFTAYHRQKHIAFDWQGEIVGTSDGSISYTFDGVAQSTFLRNRIGFCVLHPAAWAGVACEIEDPDGNLLQGHFPTAISPHQPFVNIRAIRRHFADGITTEVRMEGDTFEMEDQRNWTDASFKTYSTPLDLPFPVEVQTGTQIHQAIQIHIVGAPFAAQDGARPTSVTLGSPTSLRLPRLGLSVAPEPDPLPEKCAAALRALNLAHLRIDLDPSRNDLSTKLGRAWRTAQTLDAQLEIALHLNDTTQDNTVEAGQANDELAAVAAAVEQIGPTVARWLIFGRTAKSTPPGLTAAARAVLAPLTADAEIGGGTNAYFTELNRFRPNVEEMDIVAYSLNPQVHAFDNISLVESLEAQPMTVGSARQFTDGRPIVISPITLRPRFNPNATGAEPDPAPGELPADVDPRQPSQFAAAWTMGSICHLALANVHAVTYFETVGVRGILDEQGHPYPVYHVLAALAPFAEATVLGVEFNDALQVAALGLRDGEQTRLLVVNLTPGEQTVRVAGLTGTWEMTLLGDPHSTRKLPQAEDVTGIDLSPYAIAQLDQAAAT